jgi:uncharacterized membrane protein
MRTITLSKRYILRRKYTWFIPILLLAFAVRMWDINARSLWFDEAVEYWSAAPPLWLLPRTVLATYQPPLYTFLLHMWLKVGMEAVWLRFLSVVLSMLTLVGVTTWGYRLFGLRGALIAAGITALLPSEVRYAQEIGEYALMVCGLTWALYFLDRALRGSGWKFWSLWGFFSIVSVYSHYGTSLVVVPLAAISLFEIATHTSTDATFAIRPLFQLPASITGMDGGYWLPYLAGRQVTIPPMVYSVDGDSEYVADVFTLSKTISEVESPAALAELLKARHIAYVYIGAREPGNRREILLVSPRFEAVYDQGGVTIFLLR